MKTVFITGSTPPPGPNRIQRRWSVLRASKYDPALEGVPLPINEPLHDDESTCCAI